MSLRRNLERNAQKAGYEQFKVEYKKEREKQAALPPEERKQLIRKPTLSQWKKMMELHQKKSRAEMIKKIHEKIEESTKQALDTSWDELVDSVPSVPLRTENV